MKYPIRRWQVTDQIQNLVHIVEFDQASVGKYHSVEGFHGHENLPHDILPFLLRCKDATISVVGSYTIECMEVI